MDFIREVYRVERAAFDNEILGTPEHLAMRQTRSKAVMDEFKTWLEAEKANHLPKGPMGEAISYALGQWDALTLFLTDAHLPVDDNASENALRVAALTRKNFLFAGSDTGGERAAIAYTILGCCELSDVNPVEYLVDVLPRLARRIRLCDVPDLLPARWNAAHAAQQPLAS